MERRDSIQKSVLWDVSNVQNMNAMFYNAISFNQDLTKWTTSRVTDMAFMFYGASSFNQDISLWDVSNVQTVESTFEDAISFDQDLSKWSTSSVINMASLFCRAKSFNISIGSWDTSRVTDMENMFHGAEALTKTSVYGAIINFRTIRSWTSLMDQAAPFNMNHNKIYKDLFVLPIASCKKVIVCRVIELVS